MAHTSLRNHRKLRKLARALSVSQAAAVGLLEHLWWSVAEVDSIGPDGRLDGWTAEDLASAASWTKEPAPFVEALCTSEFLDQNTGGSLAVHDWADWCPEYICKRWKDRGWVPEGWKRPRLQKRANVSKLVKTSLDSNTPNNPTQPNPTQGNPKKKGRAPPCSGEDAWTVALDAMVDSEEPLVTAEFQAAWVSWEKYRREARKALTKSTVKRQIRRLEAWGHDAAIASIDNSITNGWAGLFEPKGKPKGSGRVRAEAGKYDRIDGAN